MKTKIFLLLMLFPLINFVAAQGFCVDFDSPSAPKNLEVSGNVESILLTWSSATDTPSCSGIDYYTVKRNGDLLGEISADTLSFIDTANLEAGSYSYTVYATDKVGHNTGNSIKNDVVILSNPTRRGSSGGSSSSSYICYEEWQCSNWGECIDEEQTRTCEDVAECGTSNSKSPTSRTCVDEDEEASTTEELTSGFFATITGAVINTLGKGGTIIVGSFITLIVILTGMITVINYRSRKR